MEFNKPEWLTKEYLQNVLQNRKEHKVTIESFKIDMPIGKGNNYVSDIFKADIEYRASNDLNDLKKKSLIIKTPKRGPMFEGLLKMGMVQKEPRIYNEFSPKLKSILTKINPEEEHILAESYFSTEENVVVLEDLKVKGYKMADRLKQLDYDHCVLALKALAKFHAGSVIIYEKEPEFIKEIGRETLFQEDLIDLCKGYIVMMMNCFNKAIKKNPNLEKYKHWFEENEDSIFHMIARTLKPDENEFNVLNHGDLWVTNMLFKYDADNVPIDVKPLDLQISRYGSPVFDFMYFIEGSVQEKVKKEKMDDLIDVYLKELNSTLEKCSCNTRLEKDEFEKSLKAHSIFRVYVVVCILPIVLADPDKTELFDLSTAKEEDLKNNETNPFRGYYSNENYLRIVSERLEEFEKLGIFTAIRKPEMEFEIPKWLTKEYLQNALEHGKDYKVTIEDLKIDMPIAKGNNYACDIFRSDLKYRMSNDNDNLHSKSLIIKAPKSGPAYDEMVKCGVLEKEPKMYNQFSPKLKSILMENHPSEEYILPESFLSPEENVLILEDLRPMGYTMADRLQRFDYDHCVVALKALAKFHAGSVRLYENEPDLIKEVGQEIFFSKDPNELFEKYMASVPKLFIEAINKYPQLEKYRHWFEESGNDMYRILTSDLEPNVNELNVLNHGDFWVTNMLFKYNDDKVPIGVKLIDLQISRYTSPVVDFMYFLDASVQEDIRLEKTKDFIEIYLKELNSDLEKYGSTKRLEKAEFYESLKRHAYFRLFVALGVLPFVLADPNTTEIMDMKEAKLEHFDSVENNPMKGYYTNETYINIVSKRLEEYERLGLITSK